jgi:protein-tyrosine-phosphatase
MTGTSEPGPAAGPWDLFADPSVPDPRPGDPIAEILVVCTANICRSPLAMVMLEHRVRERLGEDAPVWVRSSGVHARDGYPAAEESLRQADLRGLDLRRHRGSVTTADEVASADLVLVMSERQRSLLAGMHSAGARWTFTLPEFARLCGALKPVDDPSMSPRERIRFVVRLANGSRAYVSRPDGAEDVADPYGGPRRGYEVMATEVERYVDAIAPQLFGWRLADER